MCPYLITVQGSFCVVEEQKPQLMYVCPTSLLTMAYFAPDYQSENNQR